MIKMIYYIIFDFFLCGSSYWAVQFAKRGGGQLHSQDIILFQTIGAAWLLGSIISRKFKKVVFSNDITTIYSAFYLSFVLMVAGWTVIAYWVGLLTAPRAIVLGSFISAFFLENLILLFLLKNWFKPHKKLRIKLNRTETISEVLLLVVIMGLWWHFKLGPTETALIELSAFILFSWVVAGLLGHGLQHQDSFNNYWRYIWPYIKSYIIFLGLAASGLYALRIIGPDSLKIAESMAAVTILAGINTSRRYFVRVPRKTDIINFRWLHSTVMQESVLEKTSNLEVASKRSPIYTRINAESLTIQATLRDKYLKKMPNIYEFINDKCDLKNIDTDQSLVIRTRDIYNIKVLPEESLSFYLNLHQINDIRRVNEYLITLNHRLLGGGIVVGCFEPSHFRYRRFLNKYPYYIALSFYAIDFLIKRVIPKLPGVKRIYFTISKGKDRPISLAEGIGRLYFCGFELMATREMDGLVYFIVQKKSAPRDDPNPSYGPLIKLKRIGEDGKVFNLYKMRTMHPYSEYIQEFVYQLNDINEKGKLEGDFRRTSWGKILRKLWLDELPQLINWIKGDVALFGVRALSEHYYKLYPKDVQALRLKFKPGLVPPYYSDLPKNFKEIVDSERQYLLQRQARPYYTQWIYFWRAFRNIVFKGARSS